GRIEDCKIQTEAIETGFPSQFKYFFRNIRIFRIDDELGNILRQAGYIWKLTGTFLNRQRRGSNYPYGTFKEFTPFHNSFLPGEWQSARPLIPAPGYQQEEPRIVPSPPVR